MLNVAEAPIVTKAPPQKVGESVVKSAQAVERDRVERWLNSKIAEGSKSPFSEIVTITPVLANFLLQRNQANRPVSEINLDRIKRDLVAGRFQFNGEPVVVSDDGMLNDGQHRIRAVIETGKSIRTVIVFGPVRDSRMTLDQGVGRTVGHYLSMHGHTDTNVLAAVANYYLQYRDHGRLSASPHLRPTKSEALLVADTFKDIPDSIRAVSKKGAGVLASRSMLAFCHYAVARKAGLSAADMFFDLLMSGARLEEGNPILYCRSRLIQTKSSQNIGDRAELIFRAWNAWRRNENVVRLLVTGKRLPDLES